MNKIKVYVKNEEIVFGQSVIGFPIPDHGMCSWKDTLKTEKVMPEADKIALEIANEVAREKNAEVEVIDVSTFLGKLKAKIAGVKTTPIIIIGKIRIEGIPNKHKILQLLQC